ncbi:hypothetical protein PUS82_15025 [Cytobacillus firmus]|uniref:hypothetical protein n=1 Tax=Cytobacillus firmus TaxID=1399 RepID=UPI00237A1933|nr:hypothetical protein [Cytobacillus firmus]MDD9312587.1 hypothetical protein [Cytobacillus firmus]
MSNEGIILELFSRVKSLEGKVTVLENRLNSAGDEEEGNDIPTSGGTTNQENDSLEKITRSVARQHVIDRLNETNKDITALKGNKAKGSGVVIQSKSNPDKELKAKFYYSKSHLEHVSSWHTVSHKDITNDDIDLHIFTVSYNQEFYTFFFTSDELIDFIRGKRSDNSDLFHFYFQYRNGRYVEVRDQEYNVSKFYDRWTLVSDLV